VRKPDLLSQNSSFGRIPYSNWKNVFVTDRSFKPLVGSAGISTIPNNSATEFANPSQSIEEMRAATLFGGTHNIIELTC